MDKAFYKCVTCIHHQVDLEEEKCICILEKLNPKKKDLLYTKENSGMFTSTQGTFTTGSGSSSIAPLMVSGGPVFSVGEIKHFHQWICFYHQKFLNCPGYEKE